MAEPHTQRTPPWLIAAIGAAAVAFQLPYFDRAMFLMDEGHILQFADILADGGELYRDATLLPLPGAFYLLAAAFDLFGPSILVARWIAVVQFALLCVFAFLILRRLVSAPLAWIGLLLIFLYRIWAFPHWHMYSYSSMSQCLLAGALVALMRFVATGGRAALCVAGLATGLAVLCKQDYGVAGLVALNGVLAVRHFSASRGSPERVRAAFGWYNGPAVAIGAVTAVHFLRQGLFLEMLQQTLLNHLIGITTFEYSSLPPILPLFAQEPLFRGPYGYAVYVPSILIQVGWKQLSESDFYQLTYLWDLAIKLFFYAPYAIVGIGAARMFWIRAAARSPQRRTAFLGELALFGLAASQILALNKPVDFVHLAVLYWPLLLLVVVHLGAALRGRRGPARVLAAAAALPMLVAVGYTGQLGWQLRERYQTPLRGERAGVYVAADEERVIGSVVDYVRNHSQPGEFFAVLPYFPLISFLADRDAPHRAIYTLWPIEYIPNREQQIIDAIEASGNDRVVYHFTQTTVFPRMSEFAPQLFAYLTDHYEIERVFVSTDWGYMVAGLRRSAGPPPGRALLDFDRPQVELHIETTGAPDRAIGPEKRDHFFETANWPFRPVFALRPLSGNRRSVAAIWTSVPPDAHLRTAVSVHPEVWFAHPPSSVTFEVRAVLDGVRETLFSRTIRPHDDYRDRHWFAVDVDLGKFAGRRIQIEFTTACERPDGELLNMAGWEIPRLVRSERPRG